MVIPPDIVAEDTSGDVMVPEGSSVRLTCRAQGYPEPRVVWRREDGRPIVFRSPGQAKNSGTCLHAMFALEVTCDCVPMCKFEGILRKMFLPRSVSIAKRFLH